MARLGAFMPEIERANQELEARGTLDTCEQLDAVLEPCEAEESSVSNQKSSKQTNGIQVVVPPSVNAMVQTGGVRW